jgi:hypothetical protein
VHS